MVITEQIQNGTSILSLSGKFDFQARKDFQSAISKAEQAKPKRVVLNLTDLAFVDSSAIGLLHNVNTSFKGAGIQLCLANSQGPVKSVLDLFKMESIIPSYPSVDQACSALISA